MENPQSIEAVGMTVDEAIARGLDALNVTRDEVVIVVLDEGTRGMASARPREARVQLTVQEHPPSAALDTKDDSAARAAAQTLQELLDKMRIKAHVVFRWDVYETRGEESEVRLVLDVRGDDLGVLIGRRSETIDALQYLTRLIVSREVERPFNLIVDVEGYKTRRENQLRQLAQRMAERVASTRKPVALEPMPPHERRIVHITLREHPSVTTESVGRGDKRKVTIIPRSRK
jgi:spoIIIJ-associated protein